jgi:hypothetical protein
LIRLCRSRYYILNDSWFISSNSGKSTYLSLEKLEKHISLWRITMYRGITIGAVLASLLLMNINCDNPTEPNGSYSKIFFQRAGGGDKAFYITTNIGHEIIMNVTRYNFKDTNYTTSVFVEDSGELSNLITDVIDNKINIKGDFKQPQFETGTWVSLYVVSNDNSLTEITNTPIREKLMKLESLVENAR